MRKTLCFLILFAMLLGAAPQAGAQALEKAEPLAEVTAAAAVEVSAPSAILIDAATGTVLFEKNADERREPPASPRS